MKEKLEDVPVKLTTTVVSFVLYSATEQEVMTVQIASTGGSGECSARDARRPGSAPVATGGSFELRARDAVICASAVCCHWRLL